MKSKQFYHITGIASSRGDSPRTRTVQRLLSTLVLVSPALLGAKGCELGNLGSSLEPCGVSGTEMCPTDEFCLFEEDASCGKENVPGQCTTRPEVCTRIYAPVCGCDDKTYGSACDANNAGVSVAHDGPCEGDEDPDEPTTCGGLQGEACDKGEFCNFPLEALCGAADATGTCQTMPENCTLQYDPVCGCDGETYGNACAAHLAGVSVQSEGPCDDDEDPGDDPSACGGIAGLSCDDEEFCNYAEGPGCHVADASGVCEPIPETCSDDENPVCGCDGKTYGNACRANASAVTVDYEGACQEPTTECGGLLGLECAKDEFCAYSISAMCGAADALGACMSPPEACDTVYDPVCGCDGVTYENECTAHAQGVSAASPGECDAPEWDCGSIAGLACEEGYFCDYARFDQCGISDGVGLCTRMPEACTKQYDPVCGCDGMTYGNACEAHASGASILHPGSCE